MARKLRVVWSEKAAGDLERVCEYIANRSAYYAKVTAEKVIFLIEKAAPFPSSGRIVPEYGREDLRERIHKSYRKVYRVREDSIEIVTIFHAARLIQNVIDEKLV